MSHRVSVVCGKAANELVHVRRPELQRGHGSCQCGCALRTVSSTSSTAATDVGVVVGLPLGSGYSAAPRRGRQANGDE